MDVLDKLAKRGAVYTDMHFIYTSGNHGPNYINMDPLFPDTALVSNIGAALAEPFGETSPDKLTVVGAATGGIPLALATALGHGELPSVDSLNYGLAVWADKQVSVGADGKKITNFAFERAGFAQAVRGRQCLIVEDLLNSGKTTKQLIQLVRETGGEVIGVSVVCNRGNQTAETLDVPVLESLADVDFQMFPEGACPLCEKKVPIVLDVGHGLKFRTEHRDLDIEYASLLS